MVEFKDKSNAELIFSFPDELKFEKLDEEGATLPHGMKLVDLVIERAEDILLIEIKDYSHSKSRNIESDYRKLQSDEVVNKEFTPKVRDSYTFLHLMDRASKPLKYAVVLGLDAHSTKKQKAVLEPLKDRLLRRIRQEADEPWKKRYIDDCHVMSVDIWNKVFPDWNVTRISARTGEE